MILNKSSIFLWGGIISIISVSLYLSRLRRLRQYEIIATEQRIQQQNTNEFIDDHNNNIDLVVSQNLETDEITFFKNLKTVLIWLWVFNLFLNEFSRIHCGGNTVLSFVLSFLAKRLKLKGFRRLSGLLQTISIKWNRFWISSLPNNYHQLIDGRDNERISDSIKRLSSSYSHPKESLNFSRSKIRGKYEMNKQKVKNGIQRFKKWINYKS